MRLGKSPEKACLAAVRRIVNRDPVKAKELQVGFVAVSRSGEVGAYSVLKGFAYSVTNGEFPAGKVFNAKNVL
jgi:N4-(beta-N-acetylglucosaminyl)-L-asparaginase